MESKEYSIISTPSSDSVDDGDLAEDSSDSFIYNIKLTEELMEKLTKGQNDLNNLQGIEFIHTDKLGTNLLKIGNETFSFMKVKEGQPVHILSNPSKYSSKLYFVGSVTHKLNPKLELEASKAEAIRQRSQDAEKERLSRKTVELDVLPSGNHSKGQKRMITRRPSITSKSSNVINRSLSKSCSNTTGTINSSSSSLNVIPLRTRMLQLLAIGPISIENVKLKLNFSLSVLGESLDELCVDSSNCKSLILNPKFYREVKVTDWPYYNMREREQVARNIEQAQTPPTSIASNSLPISTTTPPETPSPKKQSHSVHFQQTVTSAVPNSAKKVASAKDRLNAIMKRRK